MGNLDALCLSTPKSGAHNVGIIVPFLVNVYLLYADVVCCNLWRNKIFYKLGVGAYRSLKTFLLN